jgi:hypothetical protein
MQYNDVITAVDGGPDKKFVEEFVFGDGAEDFEVLSAGGEWVTVKGVGKTVPYAKWRVEVEDGRSFTGADEHILIGLVGGLWTEVYLRDLGPGDVLYTDEGPAAVSSCGPLGGEDENMYDLQLLGDNKLFYMSGFLSHNTLWMGNLACQAVMAGNNVAVITLEMSEDKYVRRMGSNLLNIKMQEYKSKANDREYLKSRIADLSFKNLSALPGKLWVKEFPTSTASVPDVESWLVRMEQKHNIKFKIVVIDYINIMKNWRNPNTENTYMKIKQIAEDVRSMAQRNEWAVISATQTKQSAFDEEDMAMNAVSESSGLVATVDLMFGIIQTPKMYSESQYKLKVLANRDEGYKNAMKIFNVDYPYMRIQEDPTTPILEGRLQ